VLPALRTRQLDAGLRVALTPQLRLVTGLFTVTKPYFNLDLLDGEFRELGDVRHRDLELSLSGALSPRVDVLAGAVLMDLEVTGAAVEDGRVGARPLGQPRSRSLIGVNYRPARLQNWLLDATMTRVGSRSANLAATTETPAMTTLNAGFRSFTVNSAPAVLRVQVVNVTDEFAWQVNRSGAFQPNQERTLVGSLAVDF
jgi:iron complex outermembrane recepter protein